VWGQDTACGDFLTASANALPTRLAAATKTGVCSQVDAREIGGAVMTRIAVSCRCCLVVAALSLLPASTAVAQDRSADQERIDALSGEIDRLRAEIDALRAENAALRERLAVATSTGITGTTTRPAASTRPTTGPVVTRYELGEITALGTYQFRPPLNWTLTPRDDKPQSIYRSPDKLTVVQVRIKPKGAMAADLQPKVAQNIIQALKQDYLKNKTEVIDPPAAVPDGRFYLRVRERVRLKGEKTADQTHLYQMPGKDMVEVTVITTAEAPEQVAASQRLAEEMLLSLKPLK
jgi:hypothetical protein